jgi:hypothetical protein
MFPRLGRATLACLLAASPFTGVSAQQALPDFSGDWVVVGYAAPGQPDRLSVRQSAARLVIEIPNDAGASDRFIVALEHVETNASDISLPTTPPRPTSSTARWQDGALALVLVPAGAEPTRRQTWSLVGDQLRVQSSGVQTRSVGGVTGTIIARQLTRYERN